MLPPPFLNHSVTKKWELNSPTTKIMLARFYSKFFKLGFSSTCNENFQVYKLVSKRQRNQRSNCQHLLNHGKRKKNIYFCLIDYGRAFDCVDHNKLWKMVIPPYVSPEKPVCGSRNNRTGHGTIDWFKIGKGVWQVCILSPCFNFYAEYTMRHAGLDESQAGIMIAGKNINNLRYADDITLMAKVKRN